jgi:hypothetical protein
MSRAKTTAAKKQQAIQLKRQRPNISEQEIANLLNISRSSVHRFITTSGPEQAQKTGSTPQRNNVQSGSEQVQDQGSEQTTPQVGLDFEDSPVPVEKKSAVDQAFSSFKGLLGISDERDQKKAPPPLLSAKLTPQQQQFVDSITPTIGLAAIALSAWIWGHMGDEYRVLAPSEEVARQIIEPLVRIYARHTPAIGEINPDYADGLSSLVALVGYVHISLELYQHIKRQKEEQDYDQGQDPGRVNGNGRRAYRDTARPENGARNESTGYAALWRSEGTDDQHHDSNGRNPAGLGIHDLPDKERRQYEALSRLAQLDYEHRARRSIRPN